MRRDGFVEILSGLRPGELRRHFGRRLPLRRRPRAGRQSARRGRALTRTRAPCASTRSSPPRDQRNISAWAIRHPVPVCVLFLLLTLAGLFASPTLRINNSPDLELPAVVISAVQPGAGPSEIEAAGHPSDRGCGLRSRRHQAHHLHGVGWRLHDGGGVRPRQGHRWRGQRRSRPDRADPRRPAGRPARPGRDARRGRGRRHADLHRRPRRTGATNRSPGSSTTRSPRTLLFVPGVAQVNRIGGVDREIRIALKPDRLLALGVTANQVNAQLRDLNLNLPGGRGTSAAASRRSARSARPRSVEELRERTIALPGGRTARLGDLAEVIDGTAEIRARGIARRPSGRRIQRACGCAAAPRCGWPIRSPPPSRGSKRRTRASGIDLVADTVDFARAGYDAAVECIRRSARSWPCWSSGRSCATGGRRSWPRSPFRCRWCRRSS